LRKIKETRTYPDAKILTDLKKRKLVTAKKVFTFKISKGPKYAREFVKEETDLTSDMLARYFISIVGVSN
jgi:phenylalanyl-tRNA synthetase alpha chain